LGTSRIWYLSIWVSCHEMLRADSRCDSRVSVTCPLIVDLRSSVQFSRQYVNFLDSTVVTRRHEFVDINSSIQITYIGIVRGCHIMAAAMQVMILNTAYLHVLPSPSRITYRSCIPNSAVAYEFLQDLLIIFHFNKYGRKFVTQFFHQFWLASFLSVFVCIFVGFLELPFFVWFCWYFSHTFFLMKCHLRRTFRFWRKILSVWPKGLTGLWRNAVENQTGDLPRT